MKKMFLTLILSLVLVGIGYSQFDSGYPVTSRGQWGLEIHVEATLDTAAATYDSIATGWIDITDFDDATQYVQLYHLFTSTAGSPNCLIDLYGNERASWTGAVNITQLVDTTTGETATYTASTLSNKRPRYINVVFEQVASGRDNTDVKAYLRFPLKDAKVEDE